MEQPTVISTFAGGGGSSLGYKLAGYEELLAIDFDQNAMKTFQLNFPDVAIWQRDITSITGQEILDFCGIKQGDLDVLDGSPPCQCVFRPKPASDSGLNLPPVPAESCHPFRSKPATL